MDQKFWSDDLRFLRYGDWHIELLFFILGYFLHFYLYTVQTIKFFKKWKKHLQNSSFYISGPKIIIRWFAVAEIWCVTYGNSFSHFRIFFALLHLQQTKLQTFWKNEKKILEISLFYISGPKVMIRWFTIPEIWCVTDGIAIFHLRLLFPLLLL